MKPRVLLTGKTGQIGGELFRLLTGISELRAPERQQLDLSRPYRIREAIQEVRPDLIVNAAAYTAVEEAETDETTAQAVNAEAPAVMAEEAKKVGAALVHFSTDYIFDGSKRSPYEENDPGNPINVYGKTKLEGERAIQNIGPLHLIFRTSWVFGTRGRNFLLTILRLSTERKELRIVDDQIGAPTLSREIARATTRILKELIEQGRGLSSFAPVSGVYHMTAGGEASWYDFAKAILQEASCAPRSATWLAAATGGNPLAVRYVTPVSTSEYPTVARRPRFSVLSNSRLVETFGLRLPDWRVQLHSAFTDTEP